MRNKHIFCCSKLSSLRFLLEFSPLIEHQRVIKAEWIPGTEDICSVFYTYLGAFFLGRESVAGDLSFAKAVQLLVSPLFGLRLLDRFRSLSSVSWYPLSVIVYRTHTVNRSGRMKNGETLDTHIHKRGRWLSSGFVVVQLELRLVLTDVHELRPLVERPGFSVLQDNVRSPLKRIVSAYLPACLSPCLAIYLHFCLPTCLHACLA